MERGLEIDEAIAARNFEETIAQAGLDDAAFAGERGFLETFEATEIEFGVGLFAIVLEARNHLREIGRAFVAVEFGHLHDDRGEDGIEAAI